MIPTNPRPALLSVAAVLTLLAAGGPAPAATGALPAAANGGASATPRSACGDHLLGADETCDTCAADCQPFPCERTGRRTVTVDLTPQSGFESVGAVTVLVTARQNVLGLPGEKDAPSVRARVKPRQADAQVFVNDLGYGLRVVVSRQGGLPAGPLLDVELDTCAGAPAPQLGDLSCRVEACAEGGGRLRGCTCAVALP
ncbi:hypothetical protein KF840_26585 [bacterium]|nr:hypothetical protein [bacterium]